MKYNVLNLTLIIFIAGYSLSCTNNSTDKNQESTEVELCQGDYLTEEQAVEKLKEFAKTYSNAEEWSVRAEKIKEQIREGAELSSIPQSDWDYPIKLIHGQKHQMNGYTVENLGLEVRHGYIIHGNLYTPDAIEGQIPAILNPHGHWFKLNDYGRFRADMQYRCAAFAKMGAIAYNWDMYGTGEDTANYHLAPESMTMQIFNTLRILDYISSLPMVDTNRIAITGASGGGTQTFIASAIDDRIDVSVPTVQISAHFYGGCACESGKPIHKSGDFETDNVEFGACFAPKPLMLISDGDDWTKNVPNVEFPYIQNIYKMFDAEDNVENAHFKDEVHNYGLSKRTAAYGFLAKHLDLNLNNILDEEGNVDESFVELLDNKQLKVFPDKILQPDPWEE